MTTLCLCGSNKSYDTCCEPLLKGDRTAETPLELMRSRYVAFCLVDINYLMKTTHPEFRIHFDRQSNESWAQQVTFTKLEIIDTTNDESEGTVTFKAYFKIDGETHIHAEHSIFKKNYGVWFFCEGQ